MVRLVAINDHQTGPKQITIVLEQLFLSNSFRCVLVSLKLLGIEQCVSVSIVIRLSASQ